MGSWSDILDEVRGHSAVQDTVRRKYLLRLHELTGRNVIAYYAGWLQKPGGPNFAIGDDDKIGLMAAVHGLDRTLGLDLVLHTPGGDVAATESIVDYLRRMFNGDFRVIVPQLAMSGGTMIACASRSIVMGKGSSLGPIDPQFNGLPAHGIVEEFNRACNEIRTNPERIPIWQSIIGKYHPSFLGECEKAIQWATEMTREWLGTGMFADVGDATAKAATIDNIVNELTDHALTKSHSRHLSIDRCREIGLKIESLEDNNDIQDAALSVHHANMITFSSTGAVKIIENHDGIAFVKMEPG